MTDHTPLTDADYRALVDAVIDDRDRAEGYSVTGPGGTDGQTPTLIETVERIVAARVAEARAEAWEEAGELADTVVVSWSAVPGLHPTAPEPHPAALRAGGARRTLVVLRSRMTEAFAARIAREGADR